MVFAVNKAVMGAAKLLFWPGLVVLIAVSFGVVGGLKNNLLAAVDVLLVLGTLVWAMAAVYPRARWIALIQIPYLLWVMFA